MRQFLYSVLAVVVLYIVCMVLCSSAFADEARTERARAIAIQIWGEVCNGEYVTIRRDRDLGYTGYADRDSGGQCRVRLRGGRFIGAQFCNTIAHEYGHLAGYAPPPGEEYPNDPQHHASPTNLMYPFVGFDNIHPLCKGFK